MLEHDIQTLILCSLGQEQIRFVDGKAIRTGIYVDKDGCYFYRNNAGSRIYEYDTQTKGRKRGKFSASPAGTPDILGVVFGVSVGIEVKRPRKRRTPVQRWWSELHEKAGGRRCVARSMEDAKLFVIELKREMWRTSQHSLLGGERCLDKGKT